MVAPIVMAALLAVGCGGGRPDETLAEKLAALKTELAERVESGETALFGSFGEELLGAISLTKHSEAPGEHSAVLWELAELSAGIDSLDISRWALDALWEIERPIARLEKYIQDLERRPILAASAVYILAREPDEEKRMSFRGLRERAQRAGCETRFSTPLTEARTCSYWAQLRSAIPTVREEIPFLLDLSSGWEWPSVTEDPSIYDVAGMRRPDYFYKSPANPLTWYARERLRALSVEYSLDVAEGLFDFDFSGAGGDDDDASPQLALYIREWLAQNVLDADCVRRWREMQKKG